MTKTPREISESIQKFPFALAPMAEVSTHPLRSIIHRYAPETILYSEMLSAYLLLNGGMFNDALLKKTDPEKTVYQLLGRDPVRLHDAAQYLESLSPFGIDFNMGCSAPDILKLQCGSWLLKEKDLVRTIIRTLRGAVKCPVSVKIRAGFESASEEFTLDFCRMLRDEGVSWITIHPRFAKQGFRAIADWNITRKVFQEIGIPVIGNGDVTNPSDAVARVRGGYCSAVMIGRAAAQKPWIFAQCGNLLTGGETAKTEIHLADIADAIVDGIGTGLPPELHESRLLRFILYFTKNFMFGHSLHTSLRKEIDCAVIKTKIREYCDRNPSEGTVVI
jgi:nifR3 family TIM-barrel protein